MANLYTFDFEEADLTAWETATGWDHTGSTLTPSITAAQHNTGAQSMLFADPGGNQLCYVEVVLSPNKAELFGSIWLYVTTFPPDSQRSFFIGTNTNGDQYFVCLNVDGTVGICGPTENTSIKNTTGTVSLNTWTRVQFHLKAAGASSLWEILLGAETATATTSETSASFNGIKIVMDNFSGATTYYVDGFMLDDAAYPIEGPGPSRILRQNSIRPNFFAPGIAR